MSFGYSASSARPSSCIATAFVAVSGASDPDAGLMGTETVAMIPLADLLFHRPLHSDIISMVYFFVCTFL